MNDSREINSLIHWYLVVNCDKNDPNLKDREKWLSENVKGVDRRGKKNYTPPQIFHPWSAHDQHLEGNLGDPNFEAFFEFSWELTKHNVGDEPRDGWLQTKNTSVILPYDQEEAKKHKEFLEDYYDDHGEHVPDEYDPSEYEPDDLPKLDEYGYEILPPLTEEEQAENDKRYGDYVYDDQHDSYWDMVYDHHEFNDY